MSINKITKSILALCTFFPAALMAGHGIKDHTNGYELYIQTKEAADYLASLSAEGQKYLYANKDEMKWWTEARFGAFICWGPSSMLKCSLGWGRRGPRPQHSTDGTVNRGIPQEIYDNQYKKFVAADFDADAWVKMVKESGQKYLIWLTKHHDGFVMFGTKLTDYNIMNTPFGRDTTKEIVQVCNKHDIKTFFYYSQPDWYNPIYASGDLEKYQQEYLYPQTRELLTNYGKIDGFWFDGLGRHPETWNAPELLKMIRTLQPGIITNHRFAPRSWRMGDFDGPERQIGNFQINRPWETCTVIGGGWAWVGDAPAISLKNAISLLVRCAGGGGNLALGVDPNGDGIVLPDHKKRFLEMGQWLKKYGESYYGTTGGPYKPGPWGTATSKDNKVYLHILSEWNGSLTLPPLPAEIKSARTLNGQGVEVTNNSEGLSIKMLANELDPLNTVIELILDRPTSNIAPIEIVSKTFTVGASAQSSSDLSEKNKAESVVASNAKEFSEGIFVRNAWSPNPKDKAPQLQISLNKEQTIDQVLIREGKFGHHSAVTEFSIEAKIIK